MERLFFQQIIGLAMALFLNSKFKGRGIVRTVIYMPAMVSGLVMGYIMYFFFQYHGGVINDVLASMGMEAYDWLGHGGSAIAVIGMLPLIVVYLFLQKYFIQGQVDSAIKS